MKKSKPSTIWRPFGRMLQLSNISAQSKLFIAPLVLWHLPVEMSWAFWTCLHDIAPPMRPKTAWSCGSWDSSQWRGGVRTPMGFTAPVPRKGLRHRPFLQAVVLVLVRSDYLLGMGTNSCRLEDFFLLLSAETSRSVCGEKVGQFLRAAIDQPSFTDSENNYWFAGVRHMLAILYVCPKLCKWQWETLNDLILCLCVTVCQVNVNAIWSFPTIHCVCGPRCHNHDWLLPFNFCLKK